MPATVEDTTPVIDKEDGTTVRQALIKGLEELGFSNQRFSHKKEPENRRADSLRLVCDTAYPELRSFKREEIRIDFYAETLVVGISVKLPLFHMCIRDYQVPGGKLKLSFPHSVANPTAIVEIIKAFINA